MGSMSKAKLFGMPSVTPTMEKGVIVKWHKKVGDMVKGGETLFDVQTDKATMEYAVVKDMGYLRKILVKDGEEVVVGDPVAIFTEGVKDSIEGVVMPTKEKPVEKKVEEVKKKAAAPAPTGTMAMPAFEPVAPSKASFNFPSGAPKGRIPASPLAKKLAKEKGLDLSTVAGTGPRGRVTSQDLDRAQKAGPVTWGSRAAPTEQAGSYEEIALTPMRKIIGTRLQQSKTFIPHFYVRMEIDAEPLTTLREQLKNCDLKLSVNDFIVRATALALREHPKVNCGYNSVNQTIVQFKTIDIAIAVAIEDGLITPIIRFADYKNLGEISIETKDLATRAKSMRLQPEEYQGGSFTISNLGMYGVSDFVAVINPPQAAILAVSGIEECVRFKNDQAIPGKKLNLTLSADHRVIDGAIAAQFLQTLKKFLENPSVLLV
jgi:pyruvate dehydrogenase E2 component (dihydrolipoamide acetyltransferase)